MKLGTLIAILGEHTAMRDTLCAAHEEIAHADQEENDQPEPREATTSGPAGWPE